MAAETAAANSQQHGMKEVDIFVKGPGPGREAAIRSIQQSGLKVRSIYGCNPGAAQRRSPAEAPPRLVERESRLYGIYI